MRGSSPDALCDSRPSVRLRRRAPTPFQLGDFLLQLLLARLRLLRDSLEPALDVISVRNE